MSGIAGVLLSGEPAADRTKARMGSAGADPGPTFLGRRFCWSEKDVAVSRINLEIARVLVLSRRPHDARVLARVAAGSDDRRQPGISEYPEERQRYGDATGRNDKRLRHLVHRIVGPDDGKVDPRVTCTLAWPSHWDTTLRGRSRRQGIYRERAAARLAGRLHSPNGNRVGRGLGILRDICNRDKHRAPLKASAGWTGEWPHVLRCDAVARAEEHPGLYSGSAVEMVGHELRYGEALLVTSGWPDAQRLEFAIDAYIDHLLHARAGTGRAASVGETLDACTDGVEMVVSRLRKEL